MSSTFPPKLSAKQPPFALQPVRLRAAVALVGGLEASQKAYGGSKKPRKESTKRTASKQAQVDGLLHDCSPLVVRSTYTSLPASVCDWFVTARRPLCPCAQAYDEPQSNSEWPRTRTELYPQGQSFLKRGLILAGFFVAVTSHAIEVQLAPLVALRLTQGGLMLIFVAPLFNNTSKVNVMSHALKHVVSSPDLCRWSAG